MTSTGFDGWLVSTVDVSVVFTAVVFSVVFLFESSCSSLGFWQALKLSKLLSITVHTASLGTERVENIFVILLSLLMILFLKY